MSVAFLQNLELSFIFLTVKKPSKVNFADAACCVGNGIKAYTALHYKANICGGETVLVLNGASVCRVVMVSLLQLI
jgi:NADPH:quinone reductase-like Zn-dependent oxidoreductase